MTHDAPHRKKVETADSSDASGSTKIEDGHELSLRSELQRKALHLISLIIPACMFVVGRTWSLILLLPLTAAAIGADVLRTRSASFARFIYKVFGFMMRPEERPAIGDRPVINGATWVLLSATLLALLFPIHVAVAVFASFMVADAAAAVVGRSVGRTHWGSNPRTIEGSLAFIVFGVATMLPITSESLLAVALSVTVGAAVEIPAWRLNDNIRVPLAMALILYLL